jgi:uncharacterized protein (TIGR02596 family)
MAKPAFKLMTPSVRSAFTLVEMLAVVGVISVILVLAVPAADQVLGGSNLTQSGQLVNDQLTLARQAAISSNRRVQVRFYQLPVASAGNSISFCAMQVFRVDDPINQGSAGTTPAALRITALTKLQTLHTGVIFANDGTHSTLLVPSGSAVLSVTGSTNIPAYRNQLCPYVGFQYLPDGSTDLDPTANATQGGWFITLVPANRVIPSGQPANFCTLRVDPIGGRVQSFRP